MHDVIIVGVPLVVILAGILLNRWDIKDLRAEMNKRFESVDRRFDALDAELRYFHGNMGKHEARLDLLERKD